MQEEFSEHMIAAMRKFVKKNVPRKLTVNDAFYGLVDATISVLGNVPNEEDRAVVVVGFIKDLMEEVDNFENWESERAEEYKRAAGEPAEAT